MGYLLEVLLTHFAIGAGFCAAAVIFFKRAEKRRFLFRFGGDHPLSLGTKFEWMRWLLIAYIGEVISSFHPTVAIYKELALSSVEAVGATVGLFVIDRIAMMFFEPESHWRPQAKVGAAVEVLPAPEPKDAKGKEIVAPTPVAVLPPAAGIPTGTVERAPGGGDGTWAEENVRAAEEAVASAAHEVANKVSSTTRGVGSRMGAVISGMGESVRGVFALRRKSIEDKRAAGEAKRREDEDARQRRMDDLRRKH